MDAKTLRQLWSTVEATQASTLTSLDDTSLIERLVGDLQYTNRALDETDMSEVSDYIRSKLSLIRDLADGRVMRATA
ncbi:MAG: hypothetical protein J7641_08560 [Cyanobacteria bacterium SID2]|nr:hypothetical protein [Cyanobacteria bacterium SID2]MBP0006577.1 hypothetical protein [Cyanobacteria bacterium SBC]